MTVTVRFAPSPTGYLHVGNMRLAIINWLFARREGGRFMLRMDDTDPERSEQVYRDAIQADLRWMDLEWDQYERQSDRLWAYEEAAERLKKTGRLYPAYETPEELGAKRKAQLARGMPPIYDRAALSLTHEQRGAMEASGRKPHWRFKIDTAATIEWDDLIHGEISFEAAQLSDPVLIREDGRPLYSFSSVVDDIEFGVTHIVRGDDHITNTAGQIQIFQALTGELPVFAHLPLLIDAEGTKLSKRLGTLSIATLREQEGIEPLTLAIYLSRMGTSDPIEPLEDIVTLIHEFEFKRFSVSSPRFDLEELKRLNARMLHAMPFDQVEERLAALGLNSVTPKFWEAVRANLGCLRDAAQWWQVVNGPVEPEIENEPLLRQALSFLPDGPWDDTVWSTWTSALAVASGLKGKPLFMPLRKALTGCDHGPDMKALLPLIGRDRAARRLAGETA
ncbi:MAG TPA: glutamate--tRNA ligase [Alphaproteobacteria bacterium]|jgi:glutamyl-tRNA synthetase|nr:glutamate--tRNA ligase [Alphaproteobacteria bacterium]